MKMMREKNYGLTKNLFYIGFKFCSKEIKKFWNIDTYGNGTITSNSGNQIVFRYAGALLLYAEALAALGTNDTKACELLNRVRNRAHASK